MKITNGELPPTYPDWMAFYRDVKKENLLDEASVKYMPNITEYPDNLTIREFDIWYIKLKCFDEINQQVQEFTCNELDKITHWLFKYENASLNEDLFRRLKEKLDGKIKLRYKFGQYD